MKALLIVGLGGALGSVLRYVISLFIGRQVPVVFPLGTLLVNITGCFLIGLFYAMSEKYTGFHSEWKLFLITGICGGFTTFSTYSYDMLVLLKQGATLQFVLYAAGSVILGLLATIVGTALLR